jgi:hypothetical protein
LRRLVKYLLGLAAVVVLIAGFVTCQGGDTSGACATPKPGTKEADVLDKARQASSFNLQFPCFLPAAETLFSTATTGAQGRQQTDLVFHGPYDMTIRQSQVAPPVTPDPAGVSKTDIDLFPNVKATFLQVNDGSQQAMYHLFWTRNALFYELQAAGPPLQQRQILEVARSLQ